MVLYKATPRHRPIATQGLIWSAYNRRTTAHDAHVARQAHAAFLAAGFELAEAKRLEVGIYWFHYTCPEERPAKRNSQEIEGVVLLVTLPENMALPTRVAYRTGGGTQWQIPVRVGGAPNFWGEDWGAAHIGAAQCRQEHSEAVEVRIWPVLDTAS